MSTLDRCACENCGRLLDYTATDGERATEPEPYACIGAADWGPWWAYSCECEYEAEGDGEPPTLRDALDPATVAALEAEVADAYERGRQDERRAVVAWLVQRQDAANRRLPMMLTPRLAAVTRGQILEAGDAANEIHNGDHLQATTSEDDR